MLNCTMQSAKSTRQKKNRDRKNSGKGTITFQAANPLHSTDETAKK
jgi:hypothetical protein